MLGTSTRRFVVSATRLATIGRADPHGRRAHVVSVPHTGPHLGPLQGP